MKNLPAAALGLLLAACTTSTATDPDDAGAAPADAAHAHDAATTPADAGLDAGGQDGGAVDAAAAPDAAVADAGPDAGMVPTCPSDVVCVESFPYTDDTRDTATQPAGSWDSYGCAPATDESGPEVIYRVTVPVAGFLSAAVYDGTGVDIDVHILGSADPSDCLDRGDLHARADVAAGTYYVVADTYVRTGVPQAGAYRLDIGFIVPSAGPCDLVVGEMARVGDNGTHLAMPATGPMVKEAHLVTQEEPAPYPATSTDELQAHYALSQARTGLVMHRAEVWAPLEGGSFYGAGIGDPSLFPVASEGWYVNMYWTSAARPARNTRMILRDPAGGPRAVVVAAGFETGPGNLAHIGGTPEETHFYLGTSHLSEMTLGIAVDTALPLGPRTCQ